MVLIIAKAFMALFADLQATAEQEIAAIENPNPGKKTKRPIPEKI